MTFFKRVSDVVKANINHLLDQAEDPEVMVKQLIRDMEESIIELRRETVRAVASEKQLQKKIASSQKLAADYKAKAQEAVQRGDEEMAKKILAKKVYTDKTAEQLETELKEAATVSEQLKEDLAKLEDKVQSARRKKEELIRRKRSAESKMRAQDSTNKTLNALRSISDKVAGVKSNESSMEDYENAILKMEAEAEAAQELQKMQQDDDIDLEKISKEKAVEDELAQLKKSLKK